MLNPYLGVQTDKADRVLEHIEVQLHKNVKGAVTQLFRPLKQSRVQSLGFSSLTSNLFLTYHDSDA